jgi:alpha-tubulin suppressor-like RCC1 family protein/uncharacterized protein YjbI with pentapeptide repeats
MGKTRAARVGLCALMLGGLGMTGPGCQQSGGSKGAAEPVSSRTEAATAENGIFLNGLGTNGVAANGIPLNGIYLNGIYLNGIPLNGIYLNGIYLNGIPLNGIYLNGIYLNGIYLNGIYLNGVPLNGIYLNGIYLNGIYLNGAPLSGATSAAFKGVLSYLVQCALGPDQTMSAIDMDGSTLSYTGVEGIDRGWYSASPDLTKSQLMGQCMQRRAGASFDANLMPNNFKLVMTYLIQCALPVGHRGSFYDFNNVRTDVAGMLGLAPEWETATASSPVSQASQEKVSACLAARTNAVGTHVQLSLRGQGLAVSTTEYQQYGRYEGAFMANLFSSTPYVKACTVQGGGMAGRLCAQPGSSCGFTQLGPCSNVCTMSGNNYTSCTDGGTTYGNVLSTFLPFESRIAGSGYFNFCLRLDTGNVVCWGRNDFGQLGDGTGGSSSTPVLTPVTVLASAGVPLANVAEVATSDTDACARKTDGSVWCWGQVGNSAYATPVDSSQSGPLTNLSVGTGYACAVNTVGGVWCWGNNYKGTVGDGTNINRTSPVPVITASGAVLSGATKVRAGWDHACSLHNDGSVFCWGANDYGQLGDGTLVTSNHAVLTQLGTLIAIELGDISDRHSCIIEGSNNYVYCWGDNAYGQLGNVSMTTSSPLPVRALGGPKTGFTRVAAGAQHSCASGYDGTLWCWGSNFYGQVGLGPCNMPGGPCATGGTGGVGGTTGTGGVGGSPDNMGSVSYPMPVVDMPAASTETSVGATSSHFVATNGVIYSFGANESGELGTGTSDLNVNYDPVRMSNFPCGDGVCNVGETPSTCPADCACTPVNGGWSAWDLCPPPASPATCGTGTQNRTCNSPLPNSCGSWCSGPSSQSCRSGPNCSAEWTGCWSAGGSTEGVKYILANAAEAKACSAMITSISSKDRRWGQTDCAARTYAVTASTACNANGTGGLTGGAVWVNTAACPSGSSRTLSCGSPAVYCCK